MHFPAALLTGLAAIAPVVNAVGNAVVSNNCGSAVYLWSVGSAQGDMQTINPGTSYSETFTHDDVTGGRSLKVTLGPQDLFNGSPQMNYAYTLDGNNVWYDLSDVFGDPFAGNKVVLAPADTSCPTVTWASGTPPAGSETKFCGTTGDIVLTLCAA